MQVHCHAIWLFCFQFLKLPSTQYYLHFKILLSCVLRHIFFTAKRCKFADWNKPHEDLEQAAAFPERIWIPLQEKQQRSAHNLEAIYAYASEKKGKLSTVRRQASHFLPLESLGICRGKIKGILLWYRMEMGNIFCRLKI